MRYRLYLWTAAAALGAAMLATGSASVAGQTLRPAANNASAIPRTPDGKPDMQGIWNFGTLMPLERPKEFADKATLTDAEAAAYEKRQVEANNADRRDSTVRATVNGTEETTDVARAYNDFWWDRGTKIIGQKRTSMVTDPSDGRIPELLPAAKRAMQERLMRNERLAEGPEDRPVADRCIHQQRTGPPMLPGGYNNHVQIVQAPGTVGMIIEQIHEFRMIPTEKQAHAGASIELWKGDSRGHWEGDTLVVDTTNFNGKMAFQGSTRALHLTERFKLMDAKTLFYEFTVEDSNAFARPWTASLYMEKVAGPIYEYACHEGNYAIQGILRGARVLEKRVTEAKTGSR
jgi:hypothetical protein